jgi:hypothetical protein
MSAENIEALRDRLDKVEKRLAFRKSWVAVLLLVNGFILGAVSSCTRSTSDTIEARRIVLKDPSGHTLAVLGVDNKWDGLEGKDYYAGIEFRDEKGEKKMSLFGTGLFVWQGNEHARLDFTGLEIGNKETEILLNERLFSFATKETQATLFSHPTGLSFTVAASGNEFGVVTDTDEATMYAASPKWEIDIGADKNGTRIVRGPKARPQIP